VLVIQWIDVIFMLPPEFNNIFAVCKVYFRIFSFRTSSSSCVRRCWMEIDSMRHHVCEHISVKSWFLFSFPYLRGFSFCHLESYLFSHCSFYIPGNPPQLPQVSFNNILITSIPQAGRWQSLAHSQRAALVAYPGRGPSFNLYTKLYDLNSRFYIKVNSGRLKYRYAVSFFLCSIVPTTSFRGILWKFSSQR